MPDYRQFDEVFPSGAHVPYDRKLQQDIEASRKHLDGVLFIDRVLKALGISKNKAYPPKTDSALRQLHQLICEAPMSMHHKLSLLYYILLDFDSPDARESASESFSSTFGMPKNYQILMKGLWYLDKMDFERALEYVAHPSLVPDFADDIISTLVRHAPNGDYSLALSYFYTVQPILKTATALELLFDAMSANDATEALLFSRTYPEHTRELLFQRLLASVLESSQGQEANHALRELAFLPFDSTEEAYFEEYLSTGDGRNFKKANDILLIRRIACDRFSEISKYRASGQWAAILEGIKSGIAGQE